MRDRRQVENLVADSDPDGWRPALAATKDTERKVLNRKIRVLLG
jgi:hypothetical protein